MKNNLILLDEIINNIENQGYYVDIPEMDDFLYKNNIVNSVIFINSICVHGNYIASYIYEQITSDKYILSESDFNFICELCDAEKLNKGKICCPKCGTLMPNLNKKDAIDFAFNDKFILYDTKCPKCNSAWV